LFGRDQGRRDRGLVAGTGWWLPRSQKRDLGHPFSVGELTLWGRGQLPFFVSEELDGLMCGKIFVNNTTPLPDVGVLVASTEGLSQVGRSNLTLTRLPGCSAHKAQHHGTRNRRCDRRWGLQQNVGAVSSAGCASAGAVGSASRTAASKKKLVKEGRMREVCSLLGTLTCVILLLVEVGSSPRSVGGRRPADDLGIRVELSYRCSMALPDVGVLVASTEGLSQVGRSNLTLTRLPGCSAHKAQHHGTRNRRCEGRLQHSRELAIA
jgi:hypothetical protein